jgi:hypothetical protein
LYLRDVIAGLRRRWYLVIIGLLLTTGLAGYVYTMVPVSYNARLSVLLLPPETATEDGANPFLNLSGMGPAMDVLARRVDADVVRTPLEEQFPDADYVVLADGSSSGPLVVAETTAPTGGLALDALNAVKARLVSSLNSMQAELGVPVPSRITLTDVSVDSKATLDSKNRTQFVVAAALAGAGLTILLTGLIDGLIMARRVRRTNSLAAASTPEEPVEAVEPVGRVKPLEPIESDERPAVPVARDDAEHLPEPADSDGPSLNLPRRR